MARPTKNEDQPRILERILQYIAEHPGCSRDDAAEHFNLAPRTMNNHLLKLRRAGKIKRHSYQYGMESGSKWEIGAVPGIKPDGPIDRVGEPRQTTVTTWEPETRCDPIVAMLFGRVA